MFPLCFGRMHMHMHIEWCFLPYYSGRFIRSHFISWKVIDSQTQFPCNLRMFPKASFGKKRKKDVSDKIKGRNKGQAKRKGKQFKIWSTLGLVRIRKCTTYGMFLPLKETTNSHYRLGFQELAFTSVQHFFSEPQQYNA